MYITQEADYAVRIVHCLAKCGVRKDARGISEEVAVTLRFSLKILGKLSAAGIVKSFKGNRGGYELAHSPEEISLLDVLSAVEGPYVLSRCIQEGACNRGVSGSCQAQRAFIRISNTINEELAQINFRDLMAEDAACDCGEDACACVS